MVLNKIQRYAKNHLAYLGIDFENDRDFLAVWNVITGEAKRDET